MEEVKDTMPPERVFEDETKKKRRTGAWSERTDQAKQMQITTLAVSISTPSRQCIPDGFHLATACTASCFYQCILDMLPLFPAALECNARRIIFLKERQPIQ